jgi:hypothetical protein
MTAVQRFWQKVDFFNGPIRPGMTRCWIWTGGKNSAGYGYFKLHGHQVRSHRFSFRLAKRREVENFGCHECDTPACVRPSHVFDGTQKDNIQDCSSKGRHHLGARTHCKRGHEFNQENAYVPADKRRTRRICRICQRDRKRLWRSNQVEMTSHSPTSASNSLNPCAD